MTDETQELTARAKWCRRLADGCADAGVRRSLEELAVELEERARTTDEP